MATKKEQLIAQGKHDFVDNLEAINNLLGQIENVLVTLRPRSDVLLGQVQGHRQLITNYLADGAPIDPNADQEILTQTPLLINPSNDLIGNGRLMQFIARADVAALPGLAALLNTDPVKTNLITHFSTNPLPADINTLRTGIATAGNTADDVFNAIVTNLPAVGTLANVRAAAGTAGVTENNLRGQARLREFIARADVAALPGLAALLNTDPVKTNLITHFSTNPLPADINTLRTGIATAGNTADDVFNAIVTNLPAVGTLANVRAAAGTAGVTENNLRGQARLREFIARADVAALPGLAALLNTDPVKTNLITHFSTNPLPADINTLRTGIATAGNTADDVFNAIVTNLPAVGTLANVRAAAGTAGVTENNLRGQARLREFIARADVAALPGLAALLNTDPVKTNLITHFSTNPLPADINTLRTGIATAGNTADDVFNAIVTNLPAVGTLANVRAAAGTAGVTENNLRGQARLREFIARADVAALPGLAALLNTDPVKTNLITHFSTNPLPADINTLRTGIATAGNTADDVFNAIVTNLPAVGTLANVRAAAGTAGVTENNLRGQARLREFIARADVAALPGLAALLNTDPVKTNLITHFSTNPLPADINTLRTGIATAGNTADDVFNAIVTNLPAVGTLANVRAAAGTAGVTENNLRGQARLREFIARADVAALPRLAALLNTDPVKTNLITHFSTNPLPADINTLRTGIATAGNTADDVFNAIVTNLPAVGTLANVRAAAGTAGVTENNLRGQARLREFIARADVAALPGLAALLNTDPVKTNLITHFSTNPLPADINTLRTGIATAGNTADDVFNAIVTNLPAVGTLANVRAAAGTAGVTENNLRGQARLREFIARADVAALPGLAALLNTDPVKTNLITHFSTNPLPADINTLRTGIATAGNTADDVFNAIVTNLPAVGTLANVRAAAGTAGVTENNLRGQARLREFIARADVAALPGLAALLNTDPVKTNLITHFSTNPLPADINTLRTGIATAGNTADDVFNAIVTNLPAVGTLANVRAAAGTAGVTENNLRGQARLREFIARADVAALPRLAALLNTDPVKTNLITHFSTNPLPADINTLRTGIATAGNTADDVFNAIVTNLPAVGTLANVRAAAGTAGVTENNLRGEARYLEFFNRADVAAMPALQAVLQDVTVKGALINHFKTNAAPDAATLRTRLAGANTADLMRAVFHDGGVFGNAGLDVNTATTLNDANQAARIAQLRGEARYQKLMAENNATLTTMQAVKDHLSAPAVKQALITHWGNPGNAAPDYANAIINLREHLRQLNPNDLAGAQSAFTQANVFGAVPNLDVAIQGLIHTNAEANNLRSQARSSKATTDASAAAVYRKEYFDHAIAFKKALDKVKTNDRASLTKLADSIRTLQGTLKPDHELQKPLTKLFEALGSPALNTQVNIPLADPEAFRRTLSNAKKGYEGLKKSVEQIIEKGTKLDTEGLNAYLEMAKIYQDEAERRIGSISQRDEEEAERILKACKKMQDAIDMAEGQLLNKKSELSDPRGIIFNRSGKLKEVEDRLTIIAECRTTLNDTIQKIDQAKNIGQVQQVNCFSDNNEVLPPGTTETDILQKVQAFTGGGAAPVAVMGVATVEKSNRFDRGAVRINYTTLEKQNSPRPGDTSDFKVASVQGVIGNAYQSQLYYERADIDKLKPDQLVKMAAIEVENFYAGLHDKNLKMTLKGNMHPKLAEAITVYCELKKYSTPVTRIRLPERSSSKKEEYKKEFAKHLKEQAPAIFHGAEGLGQTNKTVEQLQEATQTTHTHIPRGPR